MSQLEFAQQVAKQTIEYLRTATISPGETIWITLDGEIGQHRIPEHHNTMVLISLDANEPCREYFPVSHLNEYNELELFDSIVDFLTRIES